MQNTIAVEVGTTPRRVVGYNKDRTSLAIANISAIVTVFMGSDNQVTIDNGFPVYPGMIMTFSEGLGDNAKIERWMVADADADIRVTEEYGGE